MVTVAVVGTILKTSQTDVRADLQPTVSCGVVQDIHYTEEPCGPVSSHPPSCVLEVNPPTCILTSCSSEHRHLLGGCTPSTRMKQSKATMLHSIETREDDNVAYDWRFSVQTEVRSPSLYVAPQVVSVRDKKPMPIKRCFHLHARGVRFH